jgi:ArsR family transcriptional regulator, cadmium/lead-responsive transcriptional repressor
VKIPFRGGCAAVWLAAGSRIVKVAPSRIQDGKRRYHRRMAIDSVPGSVTRRELAPAAALFRSLGDPARLAIVRSLASGPARVTDLTGQLGLAQSTVSGHLACLRDCGLVTARAAGRASVYSLAQPALLDLLAAAEDVLAATGEAVALCPRYGEPR